MFTDRLGFDCGVVYQGEDEECTVYRYFAQKQHGKLLSSTLIRSLSNDQQFELASRLVGVYKVNHMTKSVTIENKDYITGR